MNVKEIMNQVDQELIYKTITDLEGPRHPIDNMDSLNKAGDYIIEKLKSYGASVELQSFKVKGFDEEFHNITGVIGDPSKPALLIGSHYDTVRNSPGANDNLSAVAVSLEVARVLMKLENPPTVMITAFTLEEGHPGILKQRLDIFKDCGVMNNEGKYSSVDMLKANKSISKKFSNKFREGIERINIFESIMKDGNLSEDEVEIARILDEIYKDFQLEDKSLSLTGSSYYVDKALESNVNIDNVIVYDCLGWIKQGHLTQKKIPVTKEMDPFIKKNKVDLENYIGNFIGIMGDKNTSNYFSKFIDTCKSDDLDIPYFGMDLPLDYQQLKKAFPDILRSDHAPFWKAGIPGIFITDFANFRSELYHTPGDLSDNLDYEMLRKIAQATIKYILNED